MPWAPFMGAWLQGTATYSGPAAGKFVIDPQIGDASAGDFTASATLEVDFGDDSDPGRVTGPHAGDLYIFRGRRGDLVKCLWHDGVGIALYAKRLERGRFQWPTPSGGAVSISAAQLGYLLEGIDWRNPVRTWRPSRAG